MLTRLMQEILGQKIFYLCFPYEKNLSCETFTPKNHPDFMG